MFFQLTHVLVGAIHHAPFLNSEGKNKSLAGKETHMGASINGGTPKSSTLIVCAFINHPFWGTPIYRNPHMYRPTPDVPLLWLHLVSRLKGPEWRLPLWRHGPSIDLDLDQRQLGGRLIDKLPSPQHSPTYLQFTLGFLQRPPSITVDLYRFPKWRYVISTILCILTPPEVKWPSQ